MTTNSTQVSPVVQAEEALQVVGVLRRMESRFATGRWEHGLRVGPTGGNCLIGAIDEASGWTQPGVAQAVTDALTARLPRPLQLVARVRPRMALAMYNDVRGRDAALRLVRRTRADLGGTGPESSSAGAPRVGVAWSSDRVTGVARQRERDLPAAVVGDR